MNAVIAMCTFCEIHGPRVIFTTQTYRSFEEKESMKKVRFYGPKQVMQQSLNVCDDSKNECDGCHSLGNVKYLSNEHESKTSFLSARQPLTEDIKLLLEHACIRSLSCELHFGKEGICYFGDENRGHVLSHAFTLKDSQARGIRRSCSFIVFMKDKQFLLNMWPFFVDNLKQIIRELQDFAERKYNSDEAENPERAGRLSSASDRSTGKIPRGLCEITNEKHIFIRIHMWLVWILSAGARHLVEICQILNQDLVESPLTYNYLARDLQSLQSLQGLQQGLQGLQGLQDLQGKVGRTTEGSTSGFLLCNQDFKPSPEFTEISKNKLPTFILRNIKSYLTKEQFRQLLYSSLTGIQILVRGPEDKTLEALYALSSLVPRACRRINHLKLQSTTTEYKYINDCNFLGIDSSVAVPVSCSNICRLDIVSDKHRDQLSLDINPWYMVKWSGVLPNKLPTLLNKLEKYLDNDKLDEVVINKQLLILQQEWANIAKILHTMRGNGHHRNDLTGLIVSLGAGLQDYSLLDCWSMGLPSNPA